MNIIN